MMRSALPFFLVLAASCSNDFGTRTVVPKATVSPSILDFGTLGVGDTAMETLNIHHLKGDIRIEDITVIGNDVDWFTSDELEFPLIIEREDTLEIDFLYSPLQAGWHVVTLEILTNGDPETIRIHARGAAVEPDLTFTPSSIDFGPVAIGETKTKPVTVRNNGQFDAILHDTLFANEVFSWADEMPVTIEAESERVLYVAFTPTLDRPEEGTLIFEAGDEHIGPVGLRGNDCEHGNPELYDHDGDGYTLCGGDCNDLDVDIRPGGVEVPDGVDQDCDGVIDEGTTAYDDDGDGFCEFDCTDGTSPGDCNDGAVDVNPAEVEINGNGIDDDCDGVVDQGTDDIDGDGYSVAGGDCDDNNADRFPGNTEIPDDLDNDCDGFVDEGTIAYDDDGDGFCEGPICTDGSTPGDCDDRVPEGAVTFPGNQEMADWQDNNCNGVVDELTDNYDDDGDGYTETGGDCNDIDPLINPAFGNC